ACAQINSNMENTTQLIGTAPDSHSNDATKTPSNQAHTGTYLPSQAGSHSAITARITNSNSNNPPASHHSPSATKGTGNSRVASKARGTTARLTQGTAIRLASGPLALTGRLSASKTGNRPMATVHCARPKVRHALQAPRRPLNTRINTATAAKDNQNPACKLASGSANRTITNAASKGDQKPRCRKRRRQSST